jgi:uncharacterized protein YcbK (DUF882 family)
MDGGYFKNAELECGCGCGFNAFDKGLLEKLDRIREYLGRPVTITSACRCASHNKAVGGVAESAHTRGLAADVAVPDDAFRYWFIAYAWVLGIKRVGVGGNFIHIDVDASKPQGVMWVYA